MFGMKRRSLLGQAVRKAMLKMETLEDRSLPTTNLSGSVFVDLNNDGIRQASEPGLSGVQVKLDSTDMETAVNLTTTTNSTGGYNFNAVRAGTFKLTQTQPTGWPDGQAIVGDSSGIAGINEVTDIVLVDDVAATDYNFTELGIALSGSVFGDTDGNGQVNGSELGLEGITVSLNGPGGITLFDVTDSFGVFTFPNLGPGNYGISAVLPSGKITTVSQPVSTTIPNAGSSTFTFNGPKIGVADASSLAGAAFRDANSDGIRQASEVGFQGISLTLNGLTTSGQVVTRSTSTATNGSFRFDGLAPGQYSISRNGTPGLGFQFGTVIVGDKGGIAGEGVIAKINLVSGDSGTGYLFAVKQDANLAILTGRVFIDLNQNGIFDVNDTAIPNSFITLTGKDNNGNNVSLSASTDADGNYRFNGVAPGTYTLRQSQPSGVLDAKDRIGSAGGLSVKNRKNEISKIVLSGGTNAINYNFTELPVPLPRTISRRIFLGSRR